MSGARSWSAWRTVKRKGDIMAKQKRGKHFEDVEILDNGEIYIHF